MSPLQDINLIQNLQLIENGLLVIVLLLTLIVVMLAAILVSVWRRRNDSAPREVSRLVMAGTDDSEEG
jgi:hypothetical protein